MTFIGRPWVMGTAPHIRANPLPPIIWLHVDVGRNIEEFWNVVDVMCVAVILGVRLTGVVEEVVTGRLTHGEPLCRLYTQ